VIAVPDGFTDLNVTKISSRFCVASKALSSRDDRKVIIGAAGIYLSIWLGLPNSTPRRDACGAVKTRLVAWAHGLSKRNRRRAQPVIIGLSTSPNWLNAADTKDPRKDAVG
jgi:hypothetical protein